LKVKGMPTLIEHFGFWPLVAQRLARMAEAPNQSLHQPLAVAMRRFDFMKQSLLFATLAPASGG
jgi:hypothetical protein